MKRKKSSSKSSEELSIPNFNNEVLKGYNVKPFIDPEVIDITKYKNTYNLNKYDESIKIDNFNCVICIKDKDKDECYIGQTKINIYKYLNYGGNAIIFIGIDNSVLQRKYILKFTKITNDLNNEIEIMKKINVSDYYYHFVKLYYSSLCTEIKLTNEHKHELVLYQQYITQYLYNAENKCALLITELFDGDLSKIFYTIEDYLILKSIFMQMFLCIYILHKHINYTHNDTHSGNFFYKKISKTNNDYFKYKIFNKDIYIKNTGFFIVLGDYGKSQKLNYDIKLTQNQKTDYNRIFIQLYRLNHIMDINGIFTDFTFEKDEDIFDFFINQKLLDTTITIDNTTKIYDLGIL